MPIRRSRLLLLVALLVLPFVEPAGTASAVGLVVNSQADEPDAAPGDGVCASTPSGQCTLRAAVMEANALPGADTISLPPGSYVLTQGRFSGAADTPAIGDLDLTSEIVMAGASASSTFISTDLQTSNGLPDDRAIEISATGVATISGVTVTGRGMVEGGGIANRGRLTLRDGAIQNSLANTKHGGGLSNLGTATLENVLIADSVASGDEGGGIYNTGSLTLRNVTLSRNRAHRGGAIFNRGSLAMTNVTIAENSAQAGGHSITNAAGTVQVQNTIISRTGNDNCDELPLESRGNNIESGDTCRLGGPSDRNNTDPRLSTLTSHGGPTRTLGLLAGSPAIDAADDASCPSTDQRGQPRPADGDGNSVPRCDIGAFEGVLGALTFTANSMADLADASPGDGVCAAASGACTLRAAIMESNAFGGAVTVNLLAGRYRLTLAGREEDAAATGDLDVKSHLTIVGASAPSTIIDAAGIDRVFEIDTTVLVTMTRLTIRGGTVGQPQVGFGARAGGIANNGSLSLNDVWITANSVFGGIGTPGQPGEGGGIVNTGSLTLTNVTMSGNLAHGKSTGGGALFNTGVAVLRNTTISNNSTGGQGNVDSGGGGILNGGTATLTNVTLYENNANNNDRLGHDIRSFGTMQVRNTLVVRGGGQSCVGAITSLGNNLEAGNTCRFDQPTDIVNADPRLAPLADNGGQTPTLALLPGSPAIDSGTDVECPSTDQRGVPRPRDGNGDGNARCDIGAFEVAATGDPLPVVCTSRPPVVVQTSATGDGRLRATISARSTNNVLRTLRFTRLANAEVEVAGQPARSDAFSVDLPPGTTQTDILVRRLVGGQAATVQVTIVDRCGEWTTFVGGGPGAF